jgi:HD-like signal output (HDOD) protein
MSPLFAASVAQTTPRTLSDWVRFFDVQSLPVLAQTAAEIEEARANEDAVDAHMLAATVEHDPLMTLKLLAHVGRLLAGRDRGEPETVTAALVMLGIPPFFRQFGPQATVEDWLAERAIEPEGFGQVLKRSRRAAHFATSFAAQRLDHDVAVIGCAALLHDFADLLLWLYAAPLARHMRERQQADPSLRSVDVQRQTLGFTLAELQHALMKAWHLPRLLADITDDERHNDSAQVRNVTLAVRLARHTAVDWENPALPDDVRDIADLLHLGMEPTRQLLQELDG